MAYSIDALNRLSESLNATGVLSKDYKSLVMSYAMACVSEGHENGRKTEREIQERKAPADLTKPGDELQSAASRMAEFIRALDEGRTPQPIGYGGATPPYEVCMAALEAQSAVDAWTKARRAR